MTLPMSRALVAPVAAMASSTSAGIAASSSGSGRYSREDRDLGLFLRGEVLAAALPERLDGLAAGLDLARQEAATSSSVSSRRSRFSTL